MADPAEDRDPPWVVLHRSDLEDMLDRAVERGRELASEASWLTAEDVAEWLGVQRETVVGYTRREGLPCRYAGRSPVFRRDEVSAWLEERRDSPASQTRKHGRRLRSLKGGRE